MPQPPSNHPATDALILGIESSCDETATAVLRGPRRVLASVVASQDHLHAKFGGVVPEIASRAHIERITPAIEQVLEEAAVAMSDLQAIAVGHRPGLIGSLLVGVSAAKALAWALGKPLIGVDHVQAHLHAAALDAEPITFPALGLVVSGGHTSLYEMADPLSSHLLGRTIDDAVGEAYDKVAAILDLGFPGGPAVDRLAGDGDPKSTHFPRSLLDAQSLDFSFSGLKTAVLYHVRGRPTRRGEGRASFPRSAADLSQEQKADVAAAFQAAAVDVLMTKIRRASEQMAGRGRAPVSLVVGGGVSANSLLRPRASDLAAELNCEIRLPKMAYCVDNAAMIAGLAHHRYEAQAFDTLELEAASVVSLP